MARPIAISVSSSETFDYVLECNREDPVEEQTVFQLRPPTVAEDERYLNNAGNLASMGSRAHEMLRDHLRGWRNYLGDDGEEVAFESIQVGKQAGKPTDASIERLPIAVRMELMNAAVARGRISDSEEVKGK